jgi:hypothetical protein
MPAIAGSGVEPHSARLNEELHGRIGMDPERMAEVVGVELRSILAPRRRDAGVDVKGIQDDHAVDLASVLRELGGPLAIPEFTVFLGRDRPPRDGDDDVVRGVVPEVDRSGHLAPLSILFTPRIERERLSSV